MRQPLVELQHAESFERKRRLGSSAQLQMLLEPLPEHLARVLEPDLQHWLGRFRELVPTETVSGCLALTRGDDCRKYHVDWVGLRLLITYLGPGTEWVPDRFVHRPALSADWHSVAAINHKIATDPKRVVRADAGDVLLLKGESFPGNAGRGAVHRSPPITKQKGLRLVFKLTSPAVV